MKITNLLSAWICCLPLTLMGQLYEKPLDSLVAKFTDYRNQALQEKIYVHTDANFHLTGETLWFKVYTVDGSFHKPMDISKVAYAEILDKTNFPVLQAKIELKNGRGSGSFFIPASLISGNYRLRVYTSWMKNFPPEFYFQQNLTIVNTLVAPEAIRRSTREALQVEFFPEGGNLVDGIQSNVAFKITDGSGKGSFRKGIILNHLNDTIASFSPAQFGIGHFLFTPSAGESYRAVLPDPPGSDTTYLLPEVHRSGFVMHLRDSGETVHVTVTSKGVPKEEVYLFVHTRQRVSYAEMKIPHGNTATFSLKKETFHEGISHITLFNSDLQPVCERLFFRHPDKELSIAVTANQKRLNTRRRSVISIETSKSPDTPTAASLSMAVYKIDSLASLERVSMYPYLWLWSDLVGSIESPDYYFHSERPEVIEATDNLMLTHGWRRFDWEDVLNKPKSYKFLPEVNGHIVTGVIRKGQQETPGVFAYLGSPGKIIRAYGSWSNADGEVRFEIKDFYGPRKIIIQTRTDSTDLYNINVQDPFSRHIDHKPFPLWQPNKKSEKELLSRSIAMQVQDIFYYESFADSIITPPVDSTAFYGTPDATYSLDDYTRFPVMEEVMREYVPGVLVRKRKDGFHFMVVDRVNGGIISGDPMVLLDGVPVLDVDDIMQFNPLLVRKLEVVERQYYLGQSLFPGIVSYTTYQGDLGGMEFDPAAVTLDYDGLQLKRRFYSPQYRHQEQKRRLPDQRYLLHWEPDIATDKSGKCQVEFFTSDVPGTYIVIIEGLTAEGHAGSRSFTFSVSDGGIVNETEIR